MKFEDFKKLKVKIGEKNFFNNYKGLSKISVLISYLGNLFSILFAYFYIFEILKSTVVSPTPFIENVMVGVSIVVLVMLELIKRFIFDKFSQSAIKEKFRFKEKESIILGIICVLLVSASFYLSNNGAEKYASRDHEIKNDVEVQVNFFSDSLNKKYEAKIGELESQNKTMFETNQTYETRISTLSAQFNDGTISSGDMRRIKNEIASVRKDRETNTSLIEKNESKIKEIKSERDGEVAKFESKKSKNADKKIEDTSGNPMLFLVFSTTIEFLILFGIWFINYYEIRSVEEYERLINKDPKFKNYNNWTEYLNIIYKNDTRIGDLLPFKVEQIKLIKANNLDLSPKDLDEILRIFTHLGVLRSKGNKKAIAISKEEAIEKIKEHLKVE